MMAEYDDVERYRKLLEDWKPGPPAKKKSSMTTMPAAPSAAYNSPKPAPAPERPRADSPFIAAGTILRLNGRTLAVYKKAVPEKEYHLVLILGPAGSVKAQGVALDGYDVEELGSIAPKWFDKLQSEMRWDRDLIVFHCYSYEDAQKVPRFEGTEERREEPRPAAPSTATAESGPATPPQPAAVTPPPPRPDQLNGNLRRGQRLQIKFGNNMWDAVYWGKDDQGQVIAHKTYETWALMHLDLKRFANSMLVDPEADLNLVQEVEQSLLKS